MDYPENNNFNNDDNRNNGEYPGNENYESSNPNYNTQPQNNQNYSQPTPSQIYNTNRNPGTSPQYHYGRPISMMDNAYIYEQQQKAMRRAKEKKDIKKSAYAPAAALLLFLAASTLFGFVLVFPDVKYLYNTNCTMFYAISILYSVFTVGIPFCVVALIKKFTGNSIHISFDKPKTPDIQTFLIILIGFGGAIIANIITNIFDGIFSGFGVSAYYSSGTEPKNTAELIIMIIGSAIIPPLVEEYAMRGVVMQALRKYGNNFAIIVSAILFGLFHGNFVQIPFAFMCGLLLGYAVCATNSLWTGVIIHALVNGFACLQSALDIYFGNDFSDSVMNVLTFAVMALGIGALIVYIIMFKNTDKTLVDKKHSELTPAQKVGTFFTNPVMILSGGILLIEAFMGLSVS